MIKYVAIWKLAEGVTEDEFEGAYRRHINAVLSRAEKPLAYRIGRVLPDGNADGFHRMAELAFSDVESLNSWMAGLTSLPEDDPANPAGSRKYMTAVLRLICEEDSLI